MKIKNLILLLTFLTSCATFNKKEIAKIDTKPKITYTNHKLSQELDLVSKFRDVDILDFFKKEDFEISNLDYLYKGEQIYINKPISQDVMLVKAEAKEPVLVIKKDDKNYNKYTKNDKYEVIEKDGVKVVKFLKQKTIYLTLHNSKTNTTKEVMLNKPVEIKEVPSLKKDIRYSELKKGKDNGRISYEVVSYDKDDPVDEKIISYYQEYNDEDDYLGKYKVSVKTQAGKHFVNQEKYDVQFGEKLEDYKGKYEDLLENLDEKTLKFSEDGKSIKGGFKFGKLKEIETNYKEENPNSKLEFVTEIKGGTEGKKVGNHTIVRKIIENGKVIFSKEEKAHVSFPGITVAVADSTFSDVSPEFEKRIYRVLPKGMDAKLEKNPADTLGMERSHGATVIGSMVDELASGNSDYLNMLIFTAPMKKMLYHHGYQQKFEPFNLYGSTLGLSNDATKDNEKIYESLYYLNEVFKANLNQYSSNQIAKSLYYYKFDKEFYNLNVHKEKQKDGTFKYLKNPKRKKDENPIYMTEEEKIAFLKDWYLKLYKILNEMTDITEEQKLAKTNIHFKVLPIGNEKQSLDTSTYSKYLSKVLDEDKNIKAINMSYGSSARFEDYKAIKEMTKEQKEKAVKEYNENPEFRTAIKIWLDRVSEQDFYKNEVEGGNLGIPSMLNYFEAKKKITLTDYQNLLDVRLLELEQRLKTSSELPLSNYDVLFVASQGNTRKINVDLTSFDENGKKIIFENGDKYYGNNFLGIHNFINYKKEEEAKKKGEKAELDYTYRKNMVGVVGLAGTKSFPGISATENISDNLRLYTMKFKGMNYVDEYGFFKEYVNNFNDYYAKLQEKLDSNEYSEASKKEIKEQMKVMQDWTNLKGVDPNGRPLKLSFARAGLEKMMTIAAEGQYYYVKELTKEQNEKLGRKQYIGKDNAEFNFEYSDKTFSKENPGSSFAAPRVTATVGLISQVFPWMTAHQIKQTIFTTADDDYRVISIKEKTADGKEKLVPVQVGLYGVDENIGWGILNKIAAQSGPGRFVKALTHETGNENFVVNIPSGYYTFRNHIEGGFDLAHHMYSRGKGLNDLEMFVYSLAKAYTPKYLMGSGFKNSSEGKQAIKFLQENNIELSDIHTKELAKIEKKKQEYYKTFSKEEQELFDDAGLEKLGKGKLVLQGKNTYTGPTLIKEGTLIMLGSSKSPITIYEGAKLKLDFAKIKEYRDLSQDADVLNEGRLYSYSDRDIINGKYKQKNNGKILVSTNAKLKLKEVDLSETNFFNYDIFRPKGSVTRRASTDILIIDKISKKDLQKLQLEDIIINTHYKFNVTTAKLDVDGNKVKEYQGKYYKESDFPRWSTKPKKDSVPVKLSDDYRVVIKLIKDPNIKNKIENENIVNMDDAKEKLEKLLEKNLKNKPNTTKVQAMEIALEDLYWMNQDEAKTLNGDVLANSQLVGYEIQDLKQSILNNKLIKGRENKISIFAESLNNIKYAINKEKGEKTILNNGLLLGLGYTTKDLYFGLGLNYVKTNMLDFDLKKDLQGTIHANTIGAFGFINFKKNEGYLNTNFSADYMNKKIDRKLLSNTIKDIQSNDLIFTTNFEGGYTFKLQENKYELTPFAQANLLYYVRGNFDENTNFGYKANTEGFLKAYMGLGLKARVNVSNKISLGTSLAYKKYLTDTTLKSNVELKDYDFKYNIKGLKLEDNVVTYGCDMKYSPIDSITLNAQYFGKNLKSHTINLGVKFEF